MDKVTYYKILDPGRVGPYSRWQWPPVGEACPRIEGSLVPCNGKASRAYHACTIDQLAFWITPQSEVYEVELGEEVLAHDSDKVYSREAKLLKRIPFSKEDWIRLGVETDLKYSEKDGWSEWTGLVQWASVYAWGTAAAWAWARPGWEWAKFYGQNFLKMLQEREET